MLQDKVGLIFGVANKRSIAWACAAACSAQGARQAFTFQADRLKENVEELANTLPDSLVVPCDVSEQAQVDAAFSAVKEKYGKLDYLIHSIAFAPREALEGEFVTTRLLPPRFRSVRFR
jgi:enoyl-[acyl-carrier protein] reductase I